MMFVIALTLLAALPLLGSVLGSALDSLLLRRRRRLGPVGGGAGQVSILPNFDPARDVIVVAHAGPPPGIASERLLRDGLIVTLDTGARIALPGWQGALSPEHFAFVPAGDRGEVDAARAPPPRGSRPGRRRAQPRWVSQTPTAITAMPASRQPLTGEGRALNRPK